MEKALQLLHEGKIKYVITTGGKERLFNRSSTPFGELAKQWYIKRGVDADKIIPENTSTTTYENAKNSLEIIQTRKFKSAFIVTSFPHILRSRKIFNDVFPENIQMDFIISDYVAGIWTLWDVIWECAGWMKYITKKIR
jgi:uncharacterized SAM-binding protein YcdF (DUF218 family)